MTNNETKVKIANIGLLSVGQKQISSWTATDVITNQVTSVFEQIVLEMLDDDWIFNRERANLEDLTRVFKLTIDSAPTPSAAGWIVGDTITGGTSLVTCTIVKKISNTEYWVTEPSDDFTDGEVLSDGSNTRDCAAGYPIIDESPLSNWDYIYVLPTDLLSTRFLADLMSDDIRYSFDRSGSFLYTDRSEGIFTYNKKIEESTDVSDVTSMPVWFQRLLSARLAYILAPNMTQDMRIRQKAELDFDRAYLMAREKNGQNTFNRHEMGNDDPVTGYENEVGGYD